MEGISQHIWYNAGAGRAVAVCSSGRKRLHPPWACSSQAWSMEQASKHGRGMDGSSSSSSSMEDGDRSSERGPPCHHCRAAAGCCWTPVAQTDSCFPPSTLHCRSPGRRGRSGLMLLHEGANICASRLARLARRRPREPSLSSSLRGRERDDSTWRERLIAFLATIARRPPWGVPLLLPGVARRPPTRKGCHAGAPADDEPRSQWPNRGGLFEGEGGGGAPFLPPDGSGGTCLSYTLLTQVISIEEGVSLSEWCRVSGGTAGPCAGQMSQTN